MVFENTRAIDLLASFRAVQLPASDDLNYRRTLPTNGISLEATTYFEPGTDLPDDLLPMMQRAFKLWSRRIDQRLQPGGEHQAIPHDEPGAHGKVLLDFVAGYAQETGCETACANHYGDSSLLPLGRSDTRPVLAVAQDFLDQHVHDDRITASGFRVLAHEFGHIFDYQTKAGHGIIDDEGTHQTYHGNCSTEGIMCHHWQADTPISPTEHDFEGLHHHYSVKAPSDHEVFGIWATVRDPDSGLDEFGIRVTRTLIAQQKTEGFIEDMVRIETLIDGTPSGGPVTTAGTATWDGDLIAVDTQQFQPVLGSAKLTLDLANTDTLLASFTGLGRTDATGTRHARPDIAYTLVRTQTGYAHEHNHVDATFYAIGADPIGAVAGRLNDSSRNLMGAYGAIRD